MRETAPDIALVLFFKKYNKNILYFNIVYVSIAFVCK